MDRKVSVIIPAYNEEECIEETLNNLDFQWIDEIIVINDGSTDDTLCKIGTYQIKVINLPVNKGKGLAVEEGLRQAVGDVIILLDADLGKSVREVEKLVKPVLEEKVDLAIALLPIRGGGLGLVRWLADKGLKLTTGKSMAAPLSGQRAFSRDVIETLIPFSAGFGLEIGMDIDLLRAGWKFKEVSCNFKHQVTGQTVTGYLHRGRQFFAILETLFQKRRR